MKIKKPFKCLTRTQLGWWYNKILCVSTKCLIYREKSQGCVKESNHLKMARTFLTTKIWHRYRLMSLSVMAPSTHSLGIFYYHFWNSICCYVDDTQLCVHYLCKTLPVVFPSFLHSFRSVLYRAN